MPTTDSEPSRHDESRTNTEPVRHGSVNAALNPTLEPDGAGPNLTAELRDPTGSAMVEAPTSHSPVGVALTAVPDPSQPVSIAPTPELGLGSVVDSVEDPTPEVNSSVQETVQESPAKPRGHFSLSDGQKASVKSIGKSIGKTTLAAAKAASTAVPTLAIVVGCLEFVVGVAEVRRPVYAISFTLNRRAICRSMTQTSIA